MIISYFSILPQYSDIVEVKISRNRCEFRVGISGIHFDFMSPELKNEHALQVTISARHILDIIEP